MSGVITILEAKVNPEQWQLLQELYAKETVNIPESIIQTSLVQSQNQPEIWRIVTHWRSQADLDEMRASKTVPVAVRIFKSVQTEPRLEIWDAVAHHHNQTAIT